MFLAYGLDSVFLSFRMDSHGALMRRRIRDTTISYIESDAPPQYREILKPDYEPGCKRRVNTASYLACLHSPQMSLTNDQVVKISPDHVETKDGHHYPADSIIYATGFETQNWLFPMKVVGKSKKDLHHVWKIAGGAEAYKGTVVTDFPNFFILYGPNAGTGQHSVIFHSECQINYSCRLLRPVLGGRTNSIMVKPEAQARDLSWVHDKLRHLVFNSGCQSWWMNPVTKKNTFIYPDPMYKYWLRTIFPRWSDFEIHKSPRSGSFLRKLVVSTAVSFILVCCVSLLFIDIERLVNERLYWETLTQVDTR